jgi:hypothetical protein
VRPKSGRVWLMKRAVMVGLLVVALFCAWTQSALGFVYDEGFNGGSGWRGVAGSIYAYDWTLVTSPPAPQRGNVVSSLYVRHVNCNPYDARWDPPFDFDDGYRDGTPHNYMHLEVGISKGIEDATNRWVFWQWNNNPNGVWGGVGADWDYRRVAVVPTGWVNGFKIGNQTMTDSGPQTWHINWSGANPVTMVSPILDLPVGRAVVSSERLWLASYGGDSPLAHFKNLQRKNSKADWKDWIDAHPLADGDNQAKYTKNSNTDLSHNWK